MCLKPRFCNMSAGGARQATHRCTIQEKVKICTEENHGENSIPW